MSNRKKRKEKKMQLIVRIYISFIFKDYNAKRRRLSDSK